MKTIEIKAVIRRMVPQECVYKTTVNIEDEDLEYINDFIDQYMNDDVRYSGEHTFIFETVDCEAQEYLQKHFCAYSDLDFQCTEYQYAEVEKSEKSNA